MLRCALERLSEKGIPPSRLRLRGLLRHLAGVERWWFRQQFADEEVLICTTRIMTRNRISTSWTAMCRKLSWCGSRSANAPARSSPTRPLWTTASSVK
ncbi:MAG TPA: DUF664 domain-containing protein [Pseudonocardiaceae bacterium]|nr:DUF664 domain-containing protein [Pseudonocardiaceae bacterium]